MVRLLVLILVSFFALGCQRDMPLGGKSSITIRVPKAASASQKTGGVGAMATMPGDRKACYGINVTGAGIPLKSGVCGPQSGIVAGFVEPGSAVQVSVPKGLGRKVELYAFLQQVGENLPCPAMGANMPAGHLLNTYSVGVAENVDMSSEVTEVNITASFPGVANYIAQTLALPATCTAGGGGAPGVTRYEFQVSSAAGMSFTSGYTPATAPVKLMGRVGSNIPKVKLQSGSGVKLYVK